MPSHAQHVENDALLSKIKQQILAGSQPNQAISSQLDGFAKRHDTQPLSEALKGQWANELANNYSQHLTDSQDMDAALVAVRNAIADGISDIHSSEIANHAATSPQASANNTSHVVSGADTNDAKVITVTMVCHLGDQHGPAIPTPPENKNS